MLRDIVSRLHAIGRPGSLVIGLGLLCASCGALPSVTGGIANMVGGDALETTIPPEEMGTWSGKLACDPERGDFDLTLSLGEVGSEALEGIATIVSLDSGDEHSRFVVKGNNRLGKFVLNPTYKSRQDRPSDWFVTGIHGRFDPESWNFVGKINDSKCGAFELEPDRRTEVAALITKYGKATPEQQARLDAEAAMATCLAGAGSSTRPEARYQGGSDYLRAPAFKKGLFVYNHVCLSRETRKTSLIYSRTPPDDPGDSIEVSTGPFPQGTRISRRDVSIVPVSSVCRIFDYTMVNGRPAFCEPYGWRYTDYVRKECIDNVAAGPVGAPYALRCQIMVIGETIKPFEPGPKQTALR